MDVEVTTNALVALFFLSAMEIVLGIDNIVFITILTGRLPKSEQPRARKLGLALALVSRLALLASLSFVLQAEKPLFELTQLGLPESWLEQLVPFSESHGATSHGEVHEATEELRAAERLATQHRIEEINEISIRDLVLLIGGLFLIAKSVFEIHERVNAPHRESTSDQKKVASFVGILIQIAILDIVFSLDSVITAVGMAKDLWVMMAAVVIAVVVMLIFAEVVSRFVEENPTLKMLALSFLILIGVMLVTEGIGAGINKGYIYFAMAFALIVEFLNLKVRGKEKLVSTGGESC
jgi:predicted tellurium resistance membrane protein TerC